jgi:hypothetical protein
MSSEIKEREKKKRKLGNREESRRDFDLVDGGCGFTVFVCSETLGEHVGELFRVRDPIQVDFVPSDKIVDKIKCALEISCLLA